MSGTKALFFSMLWGLGVIFFLAVFIAVLAGLTYLADMYGVRDYFSIGLGFISLGGLFGITTAVAYKFYTAGNSND